MANQPSAAARRAFQIAMAIHRTLYRWTNGRIGGSMRDGRILLLTTTGRKTGRPRTTPLM